MDGDRDGLEDLLVETLLSAGEAKSLLPALFLQLLGRQDRPVRREVGANTIGHGDESDCVCVFPPLFRAVWISVVD